MEPLSWNLRFYTLLFETLRFLAFLCFPIRNPVPTTRYCLNQHVIYKGWPVSQYHCAIYIRVIERERSISSVNFSRPSNNNPCQPVDFRAAKMETSLSCSMQLLTAIANIIQRCSSIPDIIDAFDPPRVTLPVHKFHGTQYRSYHHVTSVNRLLFTAARELNRTGS